MQKVIPRDLFNDGNLLTNYGHLYIALENLGLEKCIHQHMDDNDSFEIASNIDGDTYLTNVNIKSIYDKDIQIFRPLNSREKYSLYFINAYEETYNIFDDNTNIITKEFIKTLRNK